MRDGKSCANYVVPSLFLAGFRAGCLQSGSQCFGKTLLIDQQKAQVVFVAVDSRVGAAIFVRGLGFQTSLEWKDEYVSLLPVQFTAEQT